MSYSKNKNCFGISEQNGTTCRYVQCKIQKFIKIRIPLLLRAGPERVVRHIQHVPTPVNRRPLGKLLSFWRLLCPDMLMINHGLRPSQARVTSVKSPAPHILLAESEESETCGAEQTKPVSMVSERFYFLKGKWLSLKAL